MSDRSVGRWVQAARTVAKDGLEAIVRCPEKDDADLAIEWLPFSGGEGGEIHLRCPTCGVENFVLSRETPAGA